MIAHLQNQTVTLYPKASLNRYGREVLTSGTDYRVRIQEVNKTRFLPNQETITILAIAYFARDVSIAMNDKVTYGSTNYKVWGINKARGMNGEVHHIKAELVKWQST